MAYYKYMYVHLYKMKRCYMHSSLKMLSYSIYQFCIGSILRKN